MSLPAERIMNNNLSNEKERQLTVAAVGDVIMADRISQNKDSRFVQLTRIIKESDIGFAHLEGVIGDTEGYPSHDGFVYVRSKPFVADELAQCGANVISCAHNHAMDFAAGGLLSTIDNLDRVGLTHAGIGRNLAEARAPAYHYSAKGRVALISMCSSFTPFARAGDQRQDCVGRPGLNPLRYETRYVVDAQALKELKRISTLLGWEKQKERRIKMGWDQGAESDKEFSYGPLGFGEGGLQKYVAGDEPGTDTEVYGPDAAANIKVIKSAKKQAGWVLVSIHSHEAGKQMTLPPKFFGPFAKQCIDAGADAIIGHGPHMLRGIEIYKGKPIFYSLGNFVFQNELIENQPAEFYERYKLPLDATLQEAWDTINHNDTRGFVTDPGFWESVCASFSFKGDRLNEVKLYPLTLWDKHRGHRGVPLLADEELGKKIIQKLNDLSNPFNTHIDFKDGAGYIRLS